MVEAPFLQALVLFVTIFFMLFGLLFTFIPPLPGTVIIWAAATFYGLMLGWEKLGWLTFSLLTFFMILGVAVDVVAGNIGAKAGGASWLAIFVGAIFGFILLLVGTLTAIPGLGCLAGMLGMVLGVLLVEWRRNKNWEAAINATKGYMAGALAGIMAKVTSGVFMMGIFMMRVSIWG